MGKRLFKLFFGLLLYSLGIVITINANVGYAPWEVFHTGVAKITGLTIGIVSIITGLVICVIAHFMGEKLGLGTLMNMLVIGIFIDLIMYFEIIPVTDSFFIGIIMLLMGLFIVGLASYFYISAQFGAGPRDSLMVAIQRKTGMKVGLCRILIEVMVLAAGWMFGGMVGVGTVILALGAGASIETAFKIMKFDATQVKHETLDVTMKSLVKEKVQ